MALQAAAESMWFRMMKFSMILNLHPVQMSWYKQEGGAYEKCEQPIPQYFKTLYVSNYSLSTNAEKAHAPISNRLAAFTCVCYDRKGC